MLGSIIWPGLSGRSYWYDVYPRHFRLNAGQPGNYVFVVEFSLRQFMPLYVGERNDLNRRLLEHDELDLIGCTHVCVHLNDDESARLQEEKDLIRRWLPRSANNRSNGTN